MFIQSKLILFKCLIFEVVLEYKLSLTQLSLMEGKIE